MSEQEELIVREAIPAELVYSVHTISLGANLTEKKLVISAKKVMVLECPIAVNVRINNKENDLIPLQAARVITGDIETLFLTTVTTSTSNLVLLTSEEAAFEAISVGDRTILIDSTLTEYDSRIAKNDYTELYNARPADANAHDTAILSIAGYKDCVLYIKNGLNENETIKLYGTLDGTNFEQIGTNISVAAGAAGYETFSEAWQIIKVNHQAAGIPASGDLIIQIGRRS